MAPLPPQPRYPYSRMMGSQLKNTSLAPFTLKTWIAVDKKGRSYLNDNFYKLFYGSGYLKVKYKKIIKRK